MRAIFVSLLVLAAALPAASAHEEPLLPDLTLTEVSYRWVLKARETWAPDPSNQGSLSPFTSEVVASVNVTNHGKAIAKDVRVYIVFGVGVTVNANPSVGDVLPGKSVITNLTLSVPAPRYCFTVDNFNKIAESDETNNDGGCHLIETVDAVGFF